MKRAWVSLRGKFASRRRSGSSGYRLFGRELDRLTVRLAIGIALLVVGPLGVGFYALCRHHFDQTIAANRRAAELQTRVLGAALRHQMMDQDKTLMAEILREIGSQPRVRRAMILNHEGEIRVSSEPDLVGRRVSRDSETCVVCHSKESPERDLWVRVKIGEEDVLRSVLPIENRPECYACHSPDQRMNGMLILDTSLGEVQAELRRDVAWLVPGAALLGLLVLSGVGFFVRRLILVRLGRLGRAARSIAAGKLEVRAPVAGDDVIASLSLDFNNMAGTVSQLVGEVREQEAQLTSIMNSLDDGLVVLDRESRVVASNLSFCRRIGAHPEVLRSRTCRDSIGSALPCCASGRECPAARCMSTGEMQRAVFQSPALHGGRSLVEEVYASPIFDEQGEVVQVVEIWRDISERVEEEQRLAEIEHMVSLGTLASGFSHEVNTPLASMLTCAESVVAQIDSCDRNGTSAELLPAIRESAQTIQSQVLRCKRITERFLRFSRGIPPSIEAIDLCEVVAGVVSLVEPTARAARVSIRVEEGQPLPAVRANAEVVQHVVLNLLVNAVQSCGKRGGAIVLSFHPGESLRLRVTDDGCGIAAEGRSHLFEPFHSRKNGGTGLGLFLSRSFMRRFGGDVRLVESQVGRGSTFEVVFARAAGVEA